MENQFKPGSQTGSQTGPQSGPQTGPARPSGPSDPSAGGRVKDEAAAAAAALRDRVGAMAEPLQEKARSVADEQKKAGAERIDGVARAISSAADELDDQMPQTAGWIRDAAAQLDRVSQSVRDRSLEDLARDANRLARDNTAAFFGLSLVAGFALARFLKSGAPAAGLEHGRTASPPLQPHPGQRPDLGPRAVPDPGPHVRHAAFPHNEL